MTALDYIDHIISRLELDPKNVDLMDLKKRAETIIVLATTEYQFSYLSPSLLAASAIYTALKCLSLIRMDLQIGAFKNLKEIRQRIQSATHCAPVSFYLSVSILQRNIDPLRLIFIHLLILIHLTYRKILSFA